MTILVVDDEQAVRDSLRRGLTLHGYDVELAHDGREALHQLRSNRTPIDLVVVDVLMPGLDGLALTRQLRADGSQLPVVMLTGRAQVSDRIEGYEAGADAYVVKPFSLDELAARIRVLLRRTRADHGPTKLCFADVELDTRELEARRGGEPMWLTPTEFALLELFLHNPRQTLPRRLIRDRVWRNELAPSNSLDVHLSSLRKKTEAGGRTRLLHTVRGVGYALRESGPI